jgi:hypothetical protein
MTGPLLIGSPKQKPAWQAPTELRWLGCFAKAGISLLILTAISGKLAFAPMMVFLHIPKTAGTSFRFILENTFGLSHCHSGHTKSRFFSSADLNLARQVFPTLRSIAGHNLVDPLATFGPGAFFMTFLREPIERVFSHYQDSVLKGTNRLGFEETLPKAEYLENLHVKLMAGSRDLDKAKRFLQKCGFVGLTKQFDLSLHILKQCSPRPLKLQYRRRRVARDNTIKRALENDSRMVAMARDYNKLDLELYDFAVQEIFPERCERAGLKPGESLSSFDSNASELSFKFVLGRFYNRCVYRQICRLRNPRNRMALPVQT